MSIRIFQVSEDGIAAPVYHHDVAPPPTAVPSAAAADAQPVIAGTDSAEWQELRERLRAQTTKKPARRSVLGL